MSNDEFVRSPRQVPAVHNDHNVYVLGAGFSADAGMPVVDGFMDKMRESHRWLLDNHFQREADAVHRVLRFRMDAAAASYRMLIDPENIEQLFSLAAAGSDDEGSDFDREVTFAIAGTLEYARATTRRRGTAIYVHDCPVDQIPSTWTRGKTLAESQRACPLYELYLGIMTAMWSAKSVDCRNTLMTFNYDLVVEEELIRLGVPFDYGFREDRVHRNDCRGYKESADVRFLKLHGSINWSVCNDAPTADDSGPAVDLDKVHLHENFRSMSESQAEPLLIPPTWRKIPIGPLSDVWSEAVAAVATATRLVIIGYSLPLADQHFKYILGAGLQRNVSLRKIIFVNPILAKSDAAAAEFKQRIYAVFRKELEDRRVLEFVPVPAAQFFCDSQFRGSINREMRSGLESSPATPFDFDRL